MRSSYRRIGDFIKPVKEKNKELEYSRLLGINIDKFFMPSVANVVGTNMRNYKIVRPNQFACNRMHVGRDYRIPIALSREEAPFLVSPAYDVFEITKPDELEAEYLMMWFSRKEFDRNAWFYTDADVRGGLAWDAFCGMELPVPPIEKQRAIVAEYNTVVNRIKGNETLNQKLEETAQALYRHWFVDNDEEKVVQLSKYIETNPKMELKKGTYAAYIEMANVSETSMSISSKVYREYKGGTRFQNYDTLLARITPCLENGKTAFVNILNPDETAAGSTEFIVMRAREKVSPYWVYCLAKDVKFRSYAISSMIGSSGRQRVHESYLGLYELPVVDWNKMQDFHKTVKPIFKSIRLKSKENQKLEDFKDLVLAKMTRVGGEKTKGNSHIMNKEISWS